MLVASRTIVYYSENRILQRKIPGKGCSTGSYCLPWYWSTVVLETQSMLLRWSTTLLYRVLKHGCFIVCHFHMREAVPNSTTVSMDLPRFPLRIWDPQTAFVWNFTQYSYCTM
jgi:hypothetical protein